ncbi:prepilin peptidase [Nocardia sp. NPDC052316]|uniref:A24 family peptidase n=1 Tax=Nocardia sp. NPDC052316 TaxID=3364329 RepID=UPI0037C6DD0B
MGIDRCPHVGKLSTFGSSGVVTRHDRTRVDGMPNVAFAALLAWCVVLSVIDFRQRRLPNSLTGGGAVAVFGYALSTTQCTAAVLGAVLLAVPYLLVHLALPAAFGAGDVKLAVGLGAAAALGGGQAWVQAAVAAPLLTGCAGIAAVGLRRVGHSADPPRRTSPSTGPSRRTSPATGSSRRISPATDPSCRISPATGPSRQIREPTGSSHQIREPAGPSSRIGDSAGRSVSGRTSPVPSGVPPRADPIAKRGFERPSGIAVPHGPAMCIATVCALAIASGGG